MAQQYPRAINDCGDATQHDEEETGDYHSKLSHAVRTGMHAFAGVGMGKHNSKEDRGLL